MEELKVEVPVTEQTEEKLDKPVIAKKRGKGRPPKAEIEAVKNKNVGKRGRPAGDAARIAEFKARLLATGGDRIIDKMVSIALNDNHPGQMAAIKLSIDRLLPISLFEDAKAGGGAPTISINISGLSSPTVEALESVEDITDVEVKPYGES